MNEFNPLTVEVIRRLQEEAVINTNNARTNIAVLLTSMMSIPEHSDFIGTLRKHFEEFDKALSYEECVTSYLVSISPEDANNMATEYEDNQTDQGTNNESDWSSLINNKEQ